MKILSLTLLLIPIIAGFELKIGGIFDSDATNLAQIFRYATEVANNEILANYRIKLDPRPVEVISGNEFAASNQLCKLLKIGISAIFGPSTSSSSAHCMNICDSKEIPYIDVRWDANTKPPVINMHPHPDVLANVFIDIIKAWEWKGFTIVYESAPWIKRAAELLKIYHDREYTVTVRRINVGLDKTNYRPVLRRVKLSGDTKVVLDCSIEVLPELLKQAQQVGLMTDIHEFIITSMDMDTIDLEAYQYGDTNITGIRLIDPENPLMENLKKFLNEMNQEYEEPDEESDNDDAEKEPESREVTPISVQSALTFDGVLLLAEAFKQFEREQLRPKKLNCSGNEAWDNGNTISNFMRNTIVHGLTGEIRFDNRGYRTNFGVEVLELTSSGVVKVATWNSTTGLNVTRPPPEPQIIVEDVGSLRDKTFIILIALTPPYGMLRDSSSDTLLGNNRFEGFGVDIIYELSQLLGFNYTFQLQEDGKYGNLDNVTQTWNGMIGRLIDGSADLAITDLTITAERESGVDFTMPFMNMGISILYRKPRSEPPSMFSFMSPFSGEVWMYLGGAYLGVSLCFFILGRLSPSEWDNPFPCIEEPTHMENQFSLSNSLWFTTGALLQQGSEIAPKAPSTRLVAAIWWFFTLIMVSSYTANLASFLTLEPATKTIDGAESLKNCHLPDYKCPVQFGAKRGGSTLNFFRDAEYETYRNMYTYMMAHPDLLFDDNEKGLQMAIKENYAFIMESSSIEYLIERNCGVTQVGGLLDDKGYGIAMRKNSTYRGALSEAVLKLQEQGKLTELKNKWWKEKKGGGACQSKGGGGVAAALKMENMYGVFFVLFIGSTFATFYGIFEWLLLIFLHAKRKRVSVKEELMDELKFIAKCGENRKMTRHRKSNSGQSNSSNRSYTSDD